LKNYRINIELINFSQIRNIVGLFVLCFIFPFIQSESYSKDTVDIKRPMLTKYNYCSDFTVNVSDKRSYDINSDSFQLDLGITDPPNLYSSLSDNFSEIYASTFKTGQVNYEFSFRMSVLDPFKNAKAVFVVYDATKNNQSFDSLVYKAEKLQIAPGNIAFGSVFVGTRPELSAQIININEAAVLIKSIRLKYGKLFTLKNPPQNQFLDTNENLKIFIEYSPITDIYPNFPTDFDSLIVETNCLRYVVPISGLGVKAGIVVEDIDFGAVEINTTACTGTEFYHGLRIFNSGTGRLFINGYYPLTANSPFYVNQPTNPNVNNLEINPLNDKLIEGICFAPTTVGEFIEPLIFKNNASGPDSIAYLRGIGYLPGPHLTSVNFGRVRLGDSTKAAITVRNSGTNPVSILDFVLSNSSPDFKIIYEECTPPIDRNNPVLLYPNLPQYSEYLQEILLIIEFAPKSEYVHEIKVIPVFDDNSEFKTGTVFNYARGFAYLPKIKADGFTFQGKTLVNIQHQDLGYININSISGSSNLYLKSIHIKPIAPTGNNEFLVISKLPGDTIVSSGLPLKIPIIFVPRDAGDRSAMVEIISDSYYGRDGSKWDTTIVYLNGTGYNKVLYAEPVYFDSVAHCALHTAYIKIKNISDTTEAYILDIVEVAGDTNAFEIDTDSIENNFVIIQPNDSIYVKVTFNPEYYIQNNFDLTIKIISDVDTSTGYIKATTKRFNTFVSLPNLKDVAPGAILQYNPPKSYDPDFDIKADFSKVNNVGLNSFVLEIKFNKKELMYLDKLNKGELIENWDFVSSNIYDIDNKFSVLRIDARGNDFLDGKVGSLIKPVFVILLSDSSQINLNLQTITFAENDNCMNIKKSDGKINLSYCGDGLRKIIISKNAFKIQSISSNPSYESNTVINYSIPYDVHTNIEIYNSFGEKISTVVNNQISEGEYFYNFDTSTISSGTYFVRMLSGPFTKTIQILVIK
jgi:hypothetical protein